MKKETVELLEQQSEVEQISQKQLPVENKDSNETKPEPTHQVIEDEKLPAIESGSTINKAEPTGLSNTIIPAPENTYVECDLNEERVHLLNEQGVLVYLPPEDVTATARNQEESDEFFELTEEELRKMMHDLISQNNQLQSAPLITAQLRREQEENRKTQLLKKYPTTILRVHFSDNFILQMPLSSESTLAEIKIQLLEYLEDSVEVGNFELFKTPPKQVLETSLPLHQLGLTPSSHVYISSNCVLKEKIRSNLSSYGGAVRDASSRLYRPITQSLHDDTNVAKDQRPKRPASEASSTTASVEKNVPKWLKLKR